MTTTTFSLAAAVAAALATSPAAAEEPTRTATAGSAALEEVTVTARRRDESLQTVPVAVTAFAAADLERQQVADLEDLNLGAPNLTIVRNTGTAVGAQIYLRGVGVDDSSFTNEPSIGTYLDDVYIGRQIGAMMDVLDFQRVEVLRGPQGTLYGRNSSGGAVKYVSRRPDLDVATGSASVAVGSRDRTDVTLTGSVPLVPGSLAVKFDGGSRDQRGWLRIVDTAGVDTGRRANAVNSQAARVSALWAPTDATQAYLSFDVARNRSGPQGIVSTNCTGLIGAGVSPFAPNSAFNVVCPFRFDPRRSGLGAPDLNRFEGWGTNLTVTTDLGWAQFKSITGVRSFDDALALDLSGNPAAAFNLLQSLAQRQVSQELQLASRGDAALGWIGGLYYFDEDVDQDAVFGGSRNIDAQASRSVAAFGEAYWRVFEGVTLTVGGRYTQDEKSIERRYFQTPTAVAPAATLPPGDNTYDENKFTPKVGLDWQATGDVLLFASWGRGYKAGGFAAARPTSAAQLSGQVVAETVDSVEAGIKSEWFDRRVRVNVTAFDAQYDNLQSSVLGADGSFSVVSGDAKFRGLELETAFRPTDGWSIYALAGYLDAEWSRPPAGIPTAVKLKHAPKSHYKIGTDFRTAPVGPGSFVFAANYRRSAEIFRSTANHRNILSPAYGIVDAQLGYELEGGRWKVLLAGENLGDKVYFTQGVSTLGRYLGEPRAYSLTLKATF